MEMMEDLNINVTTIYIPKWLDRKTALEIFNRSYFRLNIPEMYPEALSIPVFTYVAPIIVIPATIFDLIIITILMKNHLRTPTNIVLVGMAVNDMLTGMFASIWTTYYYGNGGYKTERERGLMLFWCYGIYWLFMWLPDIFHTSSVLLTLYLAIQRYFYICRPTSVDRLCTNRRSIFMIIALNSFAAATVLPRFFFFQIVPFVLDTNPPRTHCLVFNRKWYEELNPYIKIGFDGIPAFMHSIPCCLLLFFTCKLLKAIKESDKRKKTTTIANKSAQQRGGKGAPGFSKTVNSTNRILFFICGWVLFIEMIGCCASVCFTLGELYVIDDNFEILNYIAIIRSVLILLAAPFQFFVYVSMSEQFRLTARQMFSGKTLYTTQVQKTLNGNKKYSLILVDPVPDAYYDPFFSVIWKRFFKKKQPTTSKNSANGNNDSATVELTNLNTIETTPREMSQAPSFQRENNTNDNDEIARLAEIMVNDVLDTAINTIVRSSSIMKTKSVSYSKSSNTVRFVEEPEVYQPVQYLHEASSERQSLKPITEHCDFENIECGVSMVQPDGDYSDLELDRMEEETEF